MPVLKDLFDKNRVWSESIKKSDPDFFLKLSRQHSPEYLWIGCSDSRVPANEIVGLLPGEIFVHRNVGNLVIHSDLNCLSVIQYAVDILKVKHIIVTGHYGCGAIQAAMDNKEHGLIDNWLRPLKDLYLLHQEKIDSLRTETERQDLLCELNIRDQVANVSHSTIVQNAWKNNQELVVHGYVYGLEDGILKDMNISVSSLEAISSIHRIR